MVSQRGASFKLQCFFKFSSWRAKSLILSDATEAKVPALIVTSLSEDIFDERSSLSEIVLNVKLNEAIVSTSNSKYNAVRYFKLTFNWEKTKVFNFNLPVIISNNESKTKSMPLSEDIACWIGSPNKASTSENEMLSKYLFYVR